MIERELNFSGSKPLLYLVATPIGNLSEFPPRAVITLRQMDFVACEDTRNSGLLLKRFGIDKPLISCHEHNEEASSEKIISLLQEGKKVAYMSDAGYPVVSDPGERLVKKCVALGYKVAVINGPSAGICALVGSGLPADHFYFEGFLPSKPSARDREIEELKARKETIVFYESPHRIEETLKALASSLGPRKAVLARELTKAHEEYIRGSLAELASLDPKTLIGEMVLVVEGDEGETLPISDGDVRKLLLEKLKTLRSKEAIAAVSQENAVPKNRVYAIYLTLK
ncbi:MAG: 16S rRNA (cytidine(1402)-2'-O)-methyltransferase [Bacilli bacterium]|jgi:16S rRNA (cytidine1402-2'-O)-methyltransferase|nr:16S rRNA (cytidine(1402)-2'-O)-methyltransferase [Bacilli bacterium]